MHLKPAWRATSSSGGGGLNALPKNLCVHKSLVSRVKNDLASNLVSIREACKSDASHNLLLSSTEGRLRVDLRHPLTHFSRLFAIVKKNFPLPQGARGRTAGGKLCCQ